MTDSSVPSSEAIFEEIRRVHGWFRLLDTRSKPGHGLGGQLLFAGAIPADAAVQNTSGRDICELIRAANIAGAATLTLSGAPHETPAGVRAALRLGVVDFVVTSLDEALRILKNEIRKRLPVAVAVEGDAAAITNQMMQRGVQPDLLAPQAAATIPEPYCAQACFLERGAQLLSTPAGTEQPPLTIWPIPPTWRLRRAELDTALLHLLDDGDEAGRRWLRLAPRYLERRAQPLRSLAATPELAARVEALLARIPFA